MLPLSGPGRAWQFFYTGVMAKRNTHVTFIPQDMPFVNFAGKVDISSAPASENGPLNTINTLLTSLRMPDIYPTSTARMTCWIYSHCRSTPRPCSLRREKCTHTSSFIFKVRNLRLQRKSTLAPCCHACPYPCCHSLGSHKEIWHQTTPPFEASREPTLGTVERWKRTYPATVSLLEQSSTWPEQTPH